MWQLWGKFYSNGKLHEVMQRCRHFPRFLQRQHCPCAAADWLSGLQPVVFGGQPPVAGGFSLILFDPSFYSAKGVAEWPDLWHGTANREGDLATRTKMLP
jgi:hypothetical protein